MKRIVITFAFFISFITVGMSQLNYGAGAQFIFDGSAFGIQGRVLNEFSETWRGSGAFTLYLGDGPNWSIDIDAQYKLLEVSENFDLAPLAGLNLTSFPTVFGIGGTEIGINLGVFIDFVPSDSFHIYIEPKINIGGYESFAVSGGILF